MNLNRIIAYPIGFIVIALTYPVYLDYIYMLGFPDGFITELEYAQRRLARIFIAISLILGMCFIYLGIVASRKKVGKVLFAVIVLYLTSVISVALLDYYYRQHLMDGTGG